MGMGIPIPMHTSTNRPLIIKAFCNNVFFCVAAGTYRQSEKNLLNSNTSPTCPYNMVNIDPLAAEIVSLVLGTPATEEVRS